MDIEDEPSSLKTTERLSPFRRFTPLNEASAASCEICDNRSLKSF